MSDLIHHDSGCLICSADLVYSEQTQVMTCSFCSNEVSTNARCTNGHFICDACHGLGALDLIEQACLASAETDPLSLAASLMRNPAVNMHGPEHHFLIPAVLIAVYCNVNGKEDKAAKLAVARERAGDVKGGFCGFHGTCGAAMGAGIACSVLTGATPLSKVEWRLANLITASCLTAIAEAGGPRCCKRNTSLALIVGRDFLNQHIQAGMPASFSPVCSFSAKNKECPKSGCRFFPLQKL